MAQRPDAQLAREVLPEPLHRAVAHVFGQGIEGCLLVGGTALAGYYAGHRRSDDLDLFVRDGAALSASILAVESLAGPPLAARLTARQRTPQFYDSICELSGHRFTVQVVLDPGLFGLTAGARADDGVLVAMLKTLLMQKAATLVSRCAEKDLYDLRWLLGSFPELTPADLVRLGAAVDGGMTAESAVISLTSNTVRREACDFSLTEDSQAVFEKVTRLKEDLTDAFDRLARRQPVGPLGELVRLLRR